VVEAGWDDNCKSALDGLRKAIIGAVTVIHYNPEKVICCFTDTSRYFWSICITQIPKEDVNKTFDEMRHEPLAFNSGRFLHHQI
jgi:hypothetical protein